MLTRPSTRLRPSMTVFIRNVIMLSLKEIAILNAFLKGVTKYPLTVA